MKILILKTLGGVIYVSNVADFTFKSIPRPNRWSLKIIHTEDTNAGGRQISCRPLDCCNSLKFKSTNLIPQLANFGTR